MLKYFQLQLLYPYIQKCKNCYVSFQTYYLVKKIYLRIKQINNMSENFYYKKLSIFLN